MRVCHHCGKVLGDADRFCPQCGTTLQGGNESASSGTGDRLVGRTIAGGYVVLELVGVGGMGRVYRAEQTMLGRTVAIKVVHPHLLADDTSVARFYSEARTASKLNHPNSVGIIDFGRTEDGVLYLVMEFLRGKDLARVMHEEGPLPFVRIVDVLLGALAALGEAHSLGVVHRDLKPENIVIEKQRGGGEIVKVVDFGLAKLTGQPASSSITSPGLVCGTPDYMSPEQGRGEEVDGRGDLYSLGIVLWELLCDKLPFVDDTPAKVVLRHMTDPVPDPRVAAPQRNIPTPLAEIAIKAMSKRSTDRYQTADEMAAVLRRVAGSLKAPMGEVVCTTCNAPNPAGTRFCGSCGARLPGIVTTPPSVSRPPLRPSASPGPDGGPSPLVGRDRELAVLEDARAGAKHEPIRVHVFGEPGVGKSRLMRHFGAIATAEGDCVATVSPHPSGAPVPYWAVRELVPKLLGVDGTRLEALGTKESGVFLNPLERAGLSEIVAPTGIVGLDGKPRTGAVASAIATAVRVAASSAKTERVVILVDDWLQLDGPSRAALSEVHAHSGGIGLLLVTSSQRPLGVDEVPASVPLDGLGAEPARDLLAGNRAGRDTMTFAAARDQRTYLPLYLEQLRALGYTIDGEESGRPRRLADAVAQRIEKLTLSARRVLQAAAVLGERCPLGALVQIVESKDRDGLDTLRKEGLVGVESDQLVFSHPFVRDVVEASIPAEARKKLHEKALELEADSPLEVRAEHAYRAGEMMSALLLLERMGDGALARGDATASTLAFRRGLELVRREVLETGDEDLDRAIATFSRKLGDALERLGDFATADGVVREALDLVPRDGIERARLLLVLGRVATRRERPREAVRILGEALDIATQKADSRVATEAQLALARIRREEGDAIGSANAMRRAVELSAEAKLPLARQAAIMAELGEVLVEVGDNDAALLQLERSARTAIDADAPAVAALSLGTLATLDELAGRSQQAAHRYRDAALLAAKAGDAEARNRWERATREKKRSLAGNLSSE